MTTENIKTRKAYRQGELLFVPLDQEDTITLGYKLQDSSSPRWKKLPTNVIREGEATGHKHEVLSQKQGSAMLLAPVSTLLRGLSHMDFVSREDRMLVTQEPVEVVHPEHRPLNIPSGIYLIIIQREYDEVKARRIMD